MTKIPGYKHWCVIRVTDNLGRPERNYYDQRFISDGVPSEEQYVNLCDRVLRQEMDLLGRKDEEHFTVVVIAAGFAEVI